ncbi:MAG TPA: hypothetical protein VMV32_08445 [Ignavibacteriaceae bacterium]|nr:hypothetical protein [Ignavibacteriaceae bacterium]
MKTIIRILLTPFVLFFTALGKTLNRKPKQERQFTKQYLDSLKFQNWNS